MYELHPSLQDLHQRFHNSADQANAIIDELRLQPSASFTLTLDGPEAAAILAMIGQSIGNGLAIVDQGLQLGSVEPTDEPVTDAIEWAEQGLGVINELLASYAGESVPDTVPDWFESTS